MKLIQINKNNLKQAMRVAKSVFPNEWHKDALTGDMIFWPENAYKQSIEAKDKTFKYYLVTVKKPDRGKISYFPKTVGITGHYTEGQFGVIWLGWFGILEKYRGKGYGKELLEKCIAKFKRMGYKELRLYTTKDAKHEAKARQMYAKRGFKKYWDNEVDGVPCVWLKLDLIEQGSNENKID